MKRKSIGQYLRYRLLPISVMSAFMVLGIGLTWSTMAETLAANAEAETGAVTGNAAVIDDVGASGSKSVKFGSGATAAGSYFGMSDGGTLQHRSAAELASYLDGYKELGVEWVRTDIDWLRVQAAGQDSWDWSAYDQVISAITERDMKVLGILAYPPDWAKPAGCLDNYECVPQDAADFGAFAKAAAERYAPQGVHHWEIWNEPNDGRFTPAQYATVMKAAYPEIKSADPDSFVLAGGSMPNDTAGGGYSPVDFLQGIYDNDGKDYFDALAHHPYCWGGGTDFGCPLEFADWSAWSQMEETSPSLRSVMTANGDAAKKIWMTEFGAPVSGDAGNVSEARQAQMVTESYAAVKDMPWAGPLFWYSYKDRGTDPANSEHWFGLLRYDFSQRPSYNAYKSAASGQ
jgi:polysaccharide biosynthesis protein PslG